jgi:heat shock protein 4
MRTPRRCHCPAIAVYAQALGVEPSRTLNAEESVARGAALAAALQSPSFKVRPLLLQEGLLQPYTVHWRADDGGPPSGSLTLERGSPLPLTRRLTLHTNAALRVSCQQAVCGGRQLEQLAPAARPRGRSSRWAVWKDKGDDPTRTVHVDVIVDANQLPSLRATELANAEDGAEGSAAEGEVEGVEEGAAEGAAEGTAEGAEEGAEEGAGDGEEVVAEPPAAKMAPPDEALQLDEVSSFGLPAESLEALRAEEEEMQRVDAQVEATLHAKNELEACVYRTRSAAAEHVANGLVPEEEGAAMRARLAALEEWLDVQRAGLRSRPVPIPVCQ